MNQKDTLIRTIVKTIFFKIITTGITWLWIGDLGKAIALHLVLTLVYLLYERGWNFIKWGKKVAKGEAKLTRV